MHVLNLTLKGGLQSTLGPEGWSWHCLHGARWAREEITKLCCSCAATAGSSPVCAGQCNPTTGLHCPPEQQGPLVVCKPTAEDPRSKSTYLKVCDTPQWGGLTEIPRPENEEPLCFHPCAFARKGRGVGRIGPHLSPYKRCRPKEQISPQRPLLKSQLYQQAPAQWPHCPATPGQ